MILTTLLRAFFLLTTSPLQVPLLYTGAVGLVLFASVPIATANAYAFSPEVLNARKRDDSSTPCPDESADTESSGVTPVTVTVTVFDPPSATSLDSSTQTLNTATTSTSIITSNSTGTSTLASSTTSGTNSPTSTSSADTLVLIAQEAQQLNAEFKSLTTGDPCTAGQRACINSQLAQCTSPDDGSTPRWVTLACSIDLSTNQIPACAAVPPLTTTSVSSTNSTNSTSSSSATVELGCFLSSAISQRFSNAGVQGGMFPPGFGSQTSKANASKDKKAGDKLPVGAFLLLLIVIIMG